jgi:MarR family transcriptional regulator for hemolysin
MPSNSLPSYKKTNLQMVAYRRIQAALTALLKRFHLSTTQWIMLGFMSESTSGLRVTDLAKALQVEMPLITTTTQALVREGLMLTATHARDKRAKLLTLTPKGRQLVREIEGYLTNNLRQLEQGTDPQDLNVYFRMLQQLGRNATRLQAAT